MFPQVTKTVLNQNSPLSPLTNQFEMDISEKDTDNATNQNQDDSQIARRMQAMEILNLVKTLHKKGQYDEALSQSQCALQSIDLSQDINLHMKFCSIIMQLCVLLKNFDQALITYHENCAHLQACADEIDPKIVQSIMDLHSLCLAENDEKEKNEQN